MRNEKEIEQIINLRKKYYWAIGIISGIILVAAPFLELMLVGLFGLFVAVTLLTWNGTDIMRIEMRKLLRKK